MGAVLGGVEVLVEMLSLRFTMVGNMGSCPYTFTYIYTHVGLLS